jgi:release factor glutamine methyltransferase
VTEREIVLCHFGRMSRLDLYTGAKRIPPKALRSAADVLKKRARGVPLAYLLGEAPFYGRSFKVSPDVLIPRPETERLVEEALKILSAHPRTPPPEILDLGTGSGCIAASLTLEWPACRMTALDVSRKALAVARKNFKRLGLGKKIVSDTSRLFGRFSGKKALWDLIVSNPPYIPRRDWKTLPREVRHEPSLALDGGPDGLEVIDRILERAPRYLKPGGRLLLEIGDGQSKKILRKWARRPEYASLAFEKDLNGIERILIARTHG